jgi:hypothetical protein
MLHMFAGLIMMALGVWGIVAWWDVFGLVMRGVVPFSLLIIGLVALMAGYRKGSIARHDLPVQPEPPQTSGSHREP